MHENQGNSVIFYAHYTEGGVSKTGLTVTIDVYEIARDGTKAQVGTDAACTEIGDGLYRYLLASGSVDAAAEYVGVFHTATTTVDCQDIPAIWVIDRAGTEKLDSGVTLADDAITAGKFDESTAFPVKSADTGATQIARVGADSDTLETLSDEIAAVKAETAAIVEDTGTTLDTLVKDIPTNSELATALGTADDAVLAAVAAARVVIDNIHDTDLPAVKAETSGIKGKTDNLPTDPADESALEALIAGLDTKLDTIDNFLDTEVAAILEDTGTTLPATLASILEDTGTTLDDVVDSIKTMLTDIHDTDLPAVKSETASILEDTGTTLDALVKDIPTNTELATALGTADDAVLNAIASAKSVINDIHNIDLPSIKSKTAAILEDTGTTIPATLATVAKTGADGDTLKTLSDQLDSITSGSNTVEYPVTNNLGAAVQGAFVYVTTDAGGSNIIRSGYTNSAGKVTFNLDPGTYYFWTFHSDTLFSNPDVEVIA